MRKKFVFLPILIGLLAAFSALALTASGSATGDFVQGAPDIQSMSALAFGPEGVLFVGDSRGGAVFALDLGDHEKIVNDEALKIAGIEQKIAQLLGSKASEVVIHDLAVNPLSQNTYLSVSHSRAAWNNAWQLPNDLGDANILLRISPQGEFDEVRLKDVKFSKSVIPNPVAEDKKHRWKKGVSLRVDAVTDMAYSDGYLYVAGLSNEEFASTMWRMPFPFRDNATATTLEIYHGAHGQYETRAPIRTFLPYTVNEKKHLLAAYLCTPFVTFPVEDLRNGQHIKGRTIAEFGSGNYPLDMVAYTKNGKEKLLIANSNLPFMIVDPTDVAAYEGEITEEVAGYTGGVSYEIRSGVGVLHMDNFNSKFVIALRREPGGTLDLVSFPIRRF